MESLINELIVKIKIASTAQLGHWKNQAMAFTLQAVSIKVLLRRLADTRSMSNQTLISVQVAVVYKVSILESTTLVKTAVFIAMPTIAIQLLKTTVLNIIPTQIY